MELNFADLDVQEIELLPDRETLSACFSPFSPNIAVVNAFNNATAIGGAGIFGFGGPAVANATQAVVTTQS